MGLAVAVTPDGRRAVSGSYDGTLKVGTWSRARCSDSRGPCASVYAVAVTPDGRRVVSGSVDETLKVWDLEQGALLRPSRAMATGHCGGGDAGRPARGLGFDDRTLKVWDLEQGALLRDPGGPWRMGLCGGGDAGRPARGLGLLRRRSRSGTWSRARCCDPGGPCEGVRAVAVTPDGRRAVSGSDDRTLKVWDLEQGARSPPWRAMRGGEGGGGDAGRQARGLGL